MTARPTEAERAAGAGHLAARLRDKLAALPPGDPARPNLEERIARLDAIERAARTAAVNEALDGLGPNPEQRRRDVHG